MDYQQIDLSAWTQVGEGYNGQAFAKAYTGQADLSALEQKLRPYAALDIVRTYFFHPHEEPAFLAFCRERLKILDDVHGKADG